MEDVRNEVIKAIEEDRGYDYISNNYYKFTKEELKDMCLEFLYTLYKLDYDESEVLDYLKERWDME